MCAHVGCGRPTSDRQVCATHLRGLLAAEQRQRARQAAADLASHPDPTPGWERDAACLRGDPDAWYPDQGEQAIGAKRVCDGCRVRLDCLRVAVDDGETYGIWGGLTGRERQGLGRVASHGTRGRWSSGCRCRLCLGARRVDLARWREAS